MNQDMNVTELKCSNCGAKLNVSNTMDELTCSYCGSQNIPAEGSRVVGLSGAAATSQSGGDKLVAEMAIMRLREDLNALNHQKETLNKNLTAGKNDFQKQFATFKNEAVGDFGYALLDGFGLVFLKTLFLTPILMKMHSSNNNASTLDAFVVGLFSFVTLIIPIIGAVLFIIYRRKNRKNKVELLQARQQEFLTKMDAVLKDNYEQIAACTLKIRNNKDIADA